MQCAAGGGVRWRGVREARGAAGVRRVRELARLPRRPERSARRRRRARHSHLVLRLRWRTPREPLLPVHRMPVFVSATLYREPRVSAFTHAFTRDSLS